MNIHYVALAVFFGLISVMCSALTAADCVKGTDTRSGMIITAVVALSAAAFVWGAIK